MVHLSLVVFPFTKVGHVLVPNDTPRGSAEVPRIIELCPTLDRSLRGWLCLQPELDRGFTLLPILSYVVLTSCDLEAVGSFPNLLRV
jgi:hypothetical protein